MKEFSILVIVDGSAGVEMKILEFGYLHMSKAAQANLAKTKLPYGTITVVKLYDEAVHEKT